MSSAARKASRMMELPALPGFENVRRYWDRQRGVPAAKILPGEYYVSRHDELITTVLGSCVAACIRDRVSNVGGMNHFMLPERSPTESDSWAALPTDAATRYGSYAMEHLINDILKHGGRRENLEVKIFGGGRIINDAGDIGGRNVDFVHDYLKTEQIEIDGEDVGGIYPRKVVYFPRTGKVLQKRLQSMHNDTITRREQNYRKELKETPIAGEVDLF